jgi:hypothetical protein
MTQTSLSKALALIDEAQGRRSSRKSQAVLSKGRSPLQRLLGCYYDI